METAKEFIASKNPDDFMYKEERSSGYHEIDVLHLLDLLNEYAAKKCIEVLKELNAKWAGVNPDAYHDTKMKISQLEDKLNNEQ